jgi:hypothetical protein
MKWKRLITNAVMLMCALHVTAGDSLDVKPTTYEKRMKRMQNIWAALIPSHFVIQNAGNMGVVSMGSGWNYGNRRQWETDLLFGYIPKHESTRGKLTMTVKENYIPWGINLSPKVPGGRWTFEPLTASVYLNTVYGHEFWKSQPGRYPDKYYELMSTKFRLNFALGQRIMFKIPENKRRSHSRMSLFYEVSTCDLYIRSLFQDSSIPLKDILGLSIGLKFYTL